MKENTIVNDKFQFISIKDFDTIKFPNEHGALMIEGHVNSEAEDILFKMSEDETIKFTVIDSNGIRKEFFTGIIDDAVITTHGETYYLKLKCISTTQKADKHRYTRTFQDVNMQYKDVTQELENGNSTLSILHPQYGNKNIERMLVQYKETDWEFSRRIASRLGTVVIPNFVDNTPAYSIGIVQKAASAPIQIDNVSLVKNSDEARALKAHGKSPGSSNAYKIRSRDILELCDHVTYDNRDYLVYSAYYKYEGAELISYYIIKESDSFITAEHYNDDLVGASLLGRVENVKNDMVQIKVYDDINQKKYKWFKYATPYSTPNGPGWYFMPETNDEVRLRFPTNSEDEAYIASSAHISHGSRETPQVKFIRTIYNQEIVFSPESLRIADGHDSSITLDSEQGIYIETSKNLSLKAKGDITVNANGKAELHSNDTISIEKGDSIIRVAENIDISSSHTRVE